MLARALAILAVVCLVSAAIIPLQSDDSSKIVGGQNATIEEFPWQASLLNGTTGRHFCGGTILDRYTVLTAAHCVRAGDLIYVRVGSTLHRSGGDIRPVRRIVQHEDYNQSITDNDIALVILQFPLLWSERVQPANLPEFDYDLANNVTVWVTGWGTRQVANETLPEHLQSVAVQTVDQQQCIEAYRPNSTITDSMFCAGIYPGGGKDSCQGDSGGPVVEIYRNRPIVHGIVSWGRGCGLATHPGVYTRVSRFLQWIPANQ